MPKDCETIREPIAIIGMACRLPGGNNSPKEFWDFLLSKGCGIREVPEDRFSVDRYYDENPDGIGKTASRWAGFLDDIRDFDAQFFGISPREADAMDPQQRLMLTVAYEALQDTMNPVGSYSDQKTGLFVGVSQSDYRTIQEIRTSSQEAFAGTGYALCINANRISHRLNLTGPSLIVDTACSSSMVALNQAVLSLRSGGCDAAIVGGVNVLAHPSSFIAFSRAGMLSRTGVVSTFDKGANGFVRGEGGGAVVLKPLSQAEADGDRIHAVIEATSTNQDGYTSTITAPSQSSQIAMLEDLFASSGISENCVGYVEAHGTGTPVGDPIEAGAIGQAIAQKNSRHTVYIGSGKANVGHGEPAAGITGLIKAVLTVKNGIVPPSINFETPNPNIPFDALNLKVAQSASPFPEVDGKRYAVANSFGFGGSNGSVLISSYDNASALENAAVERVGMPYFFPVSGASVDGLIGNAAALLAQMGEGGTLADVSLGQLSAALAHHREHLAHRVVILAKERGALIAALELIGEDYEAAQEHPDIVTGRVESDGKLAFVFSGQGSQWWGMGRQFLLENATFARAVDDFDVPFVEAAGWSIKEELLKDEGESRIDDTTVTQPALFAIQSGLAAVWAEYGIYPDMVVGHSIGEAAASYVAKGLTLAGAARFLSKRGAIRDHLGAQGSMAAIGLGVEDVEALLPDHGKIGIAAINGPGSTTISGDIDEIHAFVEDFAFRNPNTLARVLKVDTAWHSYHLEGGEAWFREQVPDIEHSTPVIPFVSTVTGKPETQFDVEYGWLNLRKPVNYQAGVETAIDMGARVFVELGPHATLAGPTVSTALSKGAQVQVLNSISRKEPDYDVFPRTLAALFVRGIAPDWTAISGQAPKQFDLPKQSWVCEAHWTDSEESRKGLFGPAPHPFLGERGEGTGNSWRAEINTKAYPFLKDHRLQAETIFPGAGYVDVLLAAGREIFGDVPLEVGEGVIHDALFLADDKDVFLNTVYSPERSWARLYSRTRDGKDDWVLRAEGVVRPTDVAPPSAPKFDPEAKSSKEIALEYVYDVDSTGPFVNYGETFQVIERLWMNGRKTVAKITTSEGLANHFDRFLAHPALLDGCLQITDPRMSPKSIFNKRRPGDPIALPVGFKRMRFYAPLTREIMVYASRPKATEGGDPVASFVVTDLEGKVLMTADGLAMRALETSAASSASEDTQAHFVVQSFAEVRDEFKPDAEAVGHWIVVARDGQDTAPLVAGLQEVGCAVSVVFQPVAETPLSPMLSDQFGDQVEAGEIKGIVYASALAIAGHKPDIGAEALLAPIERNVSDLISLGDFMDLFRVGEVAKPRVVILTQGADACVEGKGALSRLSMAPLTAVGRVLATETPEYDVRMVDVDQAQFAQPDLLVRAMLSDTAEAELFLAKDVIRAPRLKIMEEDSFPARRILVDAADKDVNFHATMTAPGSIDDLDLFEIPVAPLGKGQVRVRVMAVGLNFRDIMAVTGLLPSEAEELPAWQNLGLEFGGVIEEVDEGVNGFAVGDRVMGMQKHCLQRFLTLDPIALSHVPDHISLEEAATIPSAFATAHYALNHVGRMGKKEKVLIHVATGGVGSAAIQMAKAVDAEIFATAGSPKKRKLLKDQGVHHVMDSRSLKFADDVERITNGGGVDLLLNSLPGDYITKGLDMMAPYGRFLEIGKRDVYADSSVGMKALRKNVSFNVLDLAAMGEERPELLAELMAELVEKFEQRGLEPLQTCVFPIEQVADAVRFMSQAKHVGKVVVSLDQEQFEIRRDPARPVSLKRDASYLVTGGTKGFGLTIADWLSRAGAGELLLVSRSGVVAPEDMPSITKMEERGTTVRIEALDVTNAAAVEVFVQKETRLRGVVHGAAVIKDGFVTQQTPEMISDVLRPKIIGGWNLHRAFARLDRQPDFLIGFSSIAQVIGSGGQSNYAAANAFLEALAHLRRSMGLEGSAINWGAMAESGFVARSEGMTNYLESVGLYGLTDQETDAGMEIALSRDTTSFVYSKADWAQIGRVNTALGKSAKYAPLLSKASEGDSEVRARLLSLQGEELVEAAKEFVKDELSSVLKVDKAIIQSDRPMNELGLDSLSSFELKMRVESALNVTLPVSKFLKAPSIDELALLLEDEVAAIRLAEEAKGEVESADVADQAEGAVSDALVLASDRQGALLALSASKLSSVDGRLAVQFRFDVALPPELDDDGLQTAIVRLCERHPILRARFETQAGTEIITFDTEAPKLVVGAKDGVLEAASGQVIGFARDGNILSVTVHQAIADDVTAAMLRQDLSALCAGQSLADAKGDHALKEALAAMAFDAESDCGKNDRAFWWSGMARGVAPVRFETRKTALLASHLGSNHGPAAAVSGTLAGMSETAQRLIAYASAIRGVSESAGPILVNLQQSLRGQIELSHVAGPFTSDYPLRVPDSAEAAALAQLRRVVERAGSHMSFDSYAAANAFEAEFEAWGVNPQQFAYREGPLGAVSAQMNYDLLLEVDGDVYRLTYDTEALPPSLAQEIAGRFERGCE